MEASEIRALLCLSLPPLVFRDPILRLLMKKFERGNRQEETVNRETQHVTHDRILLSGPFSDSFTFCWFPQRCEMFFEAKAPTNLFRTSTDLVNLSVSLK